MATTRAITRSILILLVVVGMIFFITQGDLSMQIRNEPLTPVRHFTHAEEVEAMVQALYNGFIDRRIINESKVSEADVWSANLGALAEAIESFFPGEAGGFVSFTRVYPSDSFFRVRPHWMNDSYLTIEVAEGERFSAQRGEGLPAGTRQGLEECDVRSRPPRGIGVEELLHRLLRCDYARQIKAFLILTPGPHRDWRTVLDGSGVQMALTQYVGALREHGTIAEGTVNVARDRIELVLRGNNAMTRSVVRVFPYLVNPFEDGEEEGRSVEERLRSAIKQGAVIFSTRSRPLAPVAIHKAVLAKAARHAAGEPIASRRQRFFESLAPSARERLFYEGVFPNGEFRFIAAGYETDDRDVNSDAILLRTLLNEGFPFQRTRANTDSVNLFCYPVPYGPACCEKLKVLSVGAGIPAPSGACTEESFPTASADERLSIAPTLERDCRGAVNHQGWGECLVTLQR